MKGSDFFFIALSLAVFLSSVIFASGGRGDAPTLVVESPRGKWLYQLAQGSAREIAIPGAMGDSTLVIEDGKVRFIDSPCENKLCVNHAPLSRNGDWNACLPNRVMVHIEGMVNSDGSAQDMDAIAF
jgi:hypothetical protein